MAELSPVYTPKDYESRIYDFWMQHKLFAARRDSGRKPFTILMPPPNVTSQLHMGHGAGYTMQDILIRWKRMQGFEALWLPGTDHAGIATQMMVEQSLAKEGLTRQQLGREKFTERLWQWKEKYGNLIVEQFRGMGFSCDWDRFSFTMDPKLSRAVRRIFVDLFNEGLIYRGERLVNWDPVLKTAISDDEIENMEVSGHLWYFTYPLEGSEETITIATTRPETLLGDTAVAVHPDDERYRHLIGKMVRLPLANRLIPVIADEYVKSEFGSGCVKITPAHDPNDFEIGKRHKLPMINIMNDDASMNDNTPEAFRGLGRVQARKQVVRAMKELGLFVKEESYRTSVPHSERSKEVIEPRLSLQWFVNMKSLAEPAIEVVKNGTLKFHPDLWKKTYLHWMENIQDWCISRQLWWGHRIPVWHCDDCHKHTTGMEDPAACGHCGSKSIRQDDDVLDTWFSSWLWPVSPFGWPDESPDLRHFYPTDVLVTAPEIIFLWVARMVMVGLKTQGKVPFHDVFLTATVCDTQGRKFSKTLGNGIDPLEVIDKHGTDAVRFTAVYLAPLGGRIRMSIDDFEMGGRFINKIWNASRFILSQVTPDTRIRPLSEVNLTDADKWLIDSFAVTADTANKALGTYRINDAVEGIYHMIWGNLCDWGLETAKSALSSNDQTVRERQLSVLIWVLEGCLRLAHPVIPFVSEEIWQKLPSHPDWGRPVALTVATYPQVEKLPRFEEAAARWNKVRSLVSGIRSVRSQAGLAPKAVVNAMVRTDAESAGTFMAAADDIRRLASVGDFTAGATVDRAGQCLVDVGTGYVVYIPAAGLIDVPKERDRLAAESNRVRKILDGINAKLANASFVERAPPEVLEQTRNQAANMKSQLENLTANLNALS